MKKFTIFLCCAILTVLAFGCGGAADEPAEPAAEPAATPAPPPAAAPGRGTAEVTLGDAEISVDYGRPQLKGRDMLGQLGDGQTWRFGQNEATVIETSKNLQFGETTVEAGSYSLFLKKVSADTWHLIFNRQTGQWGTSHDTSQDAYEIPMTATQSDSSEDTFTIELEGEGSSGQLIARWDTLVLTADFEVVE